MYDNAVEGSTYYQEHGNIRIPEFNWTSMKRLNFLNLQLLWLAYIDNKVTGDLRARYNLLGLQCNSDLH